MKSVAVLARSESGNRELADMLRSSGIESVPVDTIEFLPGDAEELRSAFERASAYDWVVFTSATAVAFSSDHLKSWKRGKTKVAAVGSSTAKALLEAGVAVDFVPAEYLTSALGEGLPAEAGSSALLLRADIADKALVATLRRRGVKVTEVTAYRTRTIENRVERIQDLDGAEIVVFASPSEVKAFRERMPPAAYMALAGTATAACIGPVTAKCAQEEGFGSVLVPEVHTIEALARRIEEFFLNA